MAPTRTGPRPLLICVVPAVTTDHHPDPARNPCALSNERALDDPRACNTAFLSHHAIAPPRRGLLALAITPGCGLSAGRFRGRRASQRATRSRRRRRSWCAWSRQASHRFTRPAGSITPQNSRLPRAEVDPPAEARLRLRGGGVCHTIPLSH